LSRIRVNYPEGRWLVTDQAIIIPVESMFGVTPEVAAQRFGELGEVLVAYRRFLQIFPNTDFDSLDAFRTRTMPPDQVRLRPDKGIWHE
jgi:hypothetical protein